MIMKEMGNKRGKAEDGPGDHAVFRVLCFAKPFRMVAAMKKHKDQNLDMHLNSCVEDLLPEQRL